jgi:crossover junction endodeoxyribonuclease RuvC
MTNNLQSSAISSTTLAIDPGYDRVGWAIGRSSTIRDLVVIDFGCIQTDLSQSLYQRYHQISTQIRQLIDQHTPQHLAIEQLFFSKNTTTALKVSEARGLIIANCLQANMEIFDYNPNQIKQAVTGNGQANKTAMAKMIRLQLKLSPVKIIDDTIDALAVLLTHTVAHRSHSARMKP